MLISLYCTVSVYFLIVLISIFVALFYFKWCVNVSPMPDEKLSGEVWFNL